MRISDWSSDVCSSDLFDTLKKAALSRDFKPVPLHAKASFTIDNKVRSVQSHNVIAKLEGSDPALKDEYIIYTAHWDHLGHDRALPGDQIFNGDRKSTRLNSSH